jgi:bifunctional non-homologous end joining protein LigD
MASAAGRTRVEVEGRELSLSNLDKVLYPGPGLTKGEVIAYYVDVAPALLPHVAGRPLTVRRFPDGVDGLSFYEKHLPRGTPDWVRRVTLAPSPRSTSATIEFVVIDSLATLVWLANLAALELHVPMWRVDGPGRPTPPDLMVFDLDPGAPATVVECCRVARDLADLLEAEHGLTAYPKSSGAKGLQLYVPLPKKLRGTWEDGTTAAEARRLAGLCARRRPELVVANMRKDQRVGRVLIDWSQNNVAKTTVAPYSLRARPEPTVSTPVTWDEVTACAEEGRAEMLAFWPDDVRRRIEAGGDLFGPLT